MGCSMIFFDFRPHFTLFKIHQPTCASRLSRKDNAVRARCSGHSPSRCDNQSRIRLPIGRTHSIDMADAGEDNIDVEETTEIGG